MSHNYVNDLFGRFRKGKKTKFSDLETKAKDLMKDILNNKIEYDEFFTGFSGLINEFHYILALEKLAYLKKNLQGAPGAV